MKKISSFVVFVIFCSLAFLGCMTVPTPTQEIVQKVYDFPDMNSDTLFAKSQLWASKTFISAKDAIELSNQSSGLLTIRTVYDSKAYQMGTLMSGAMYFTTYKIVLEIKDNKSRITCQNPIYEVMLSNGRKQPMQGNIAKFDNEFLQKANSIVVDYKSYMSKKETAW